MRKLFVQCWVNTKERAHIGRVNIGNVDISFVYSPAASVTHFVRPTSIDESENETNRYDAAIKTKTKNIFAFFCCCYIRIFVFVCLLNSNCSYCCAHFSIACVLLLVIGIVFVCCVTIVVVVVVDVVPSETRLAASVESQLINKVNKWNLVSGDYYLHCLMFVHFKLDGYCFCFLHIFFAYACIRGKKKEIVLGIISSLPLRTLGESISILECCQVQLWTVVILFNATNHLIVHASALSFNLVHKIWTFHHYTTSMYCFVVLEKKIHHIIKYMNSWSRMSCPRSTDMSKQNNLPHSWHLSIFNLAFTFQKFGARYMVDLARIFSFVENKLQNCKWHRLTAQKLLC